MYALCRRLFVMVLAYPVVRLWLGITLRHGDRLPVQGPAILIANHNSHLDILTLLNLFPLVQVPQVRPAAAADYFFRKPWMARLVTLFIGLIPVERGSASRDHDPLQGCYAALEAGQILVLFPEGTRGEPEQLSEIKSGLWYLARRFPEVPVIPVYLHGLGRAMARGKCLPLPLFVDVWVDRPLPWQDDKAAYKQAVRERFGQLQQRLAPQPADDAQD